MRAQSRASTRAGLVVIATLVWGIAIAAVALMAGAERSHAAVQGADKLEATIFSWDGTDFIRSKTTLMQEDGTPATNTKLDHATPAYKALKQKHSYVGDVTVFGKHYDADYAPLVGADGKLTGALFVAVPK
jgi:hypothetical protein